MNPIPPQVIGIPEEKVYLFQYGGRPLFIRLTLADAARLEARARKHGLCATQFIKALIKRHLDGDDWPGSLI
jgi:hypothetical protein